jgi:hypothetical protein
MATRREPRPSTASSPRCIAERTPLAELKRRYDAAS